MPMCTRRERGLQSRSLAVPYKLYSQILNFGRGFSKFKLLLQGIIKHNTRILFIASQTGNPEDHILTCANKRSWQWLVASSQAQAFLSGPVMLPSVPRVNSESVRWSTATIREHKRTYLPWPDPHWQTWSLCPCNLHKAVACLIANPALN